MYRLLVVDDDLNTCKRIAHYLDTSFSELDIVDTSFSGDDAFSLFEKNPYDLVYTDIAMPRGDGMELIANIRQSGYDPLIVIISAYENFEYARCAVQFGVKEYLIKPVLPDQISEVTSRLINELNKQNTLQITNDEKSREQIFADVVNRRNFFYYLLRIESNDERFFKEAKLVGIDLSGTRFMTAIMRIDTKKPLDQEIVFDIYQLCIASVNRINSFFKVNGILLENDDIVFLTTNDGKNGETLFSQTNRFLNQIILDIQKRTGISCIASFGSCYKSIQEVQISFDEAKNVFENIDKDVFELPRQIDKEKSVFIDQETEDTLISSVKYRDFPFCTAIAKKIAAQISLGHFTNPQMVVNYYIQLSGFLLSDFRHSCSLKDCFLPDYGILVKANDINTCHEWFLSFLKRLISSYEAYNHQSGNYFVNQARKIMRDNISDSSFSINVVAAKLFISSNYLRFLFARESEGSFVEQMTDMRMSLALRLLQNSNLKIHNIAEQSGYSNQRYFAVCFKKYFGKTPSEIREET